MAYTDTRNTSARAPAVIGVAVIHAAIGVVLVTGLASTITEKFTPPPLVGEQFKLPPPPPPEPKPEPRVEPEPSTAPPVYTPAPPFQLDPQPPVLDTTDLLPPATPLPIPRADPGPSPRLSVTPTPSKLFDPVAPKPRNGDWVTDNDYRSSWINRGWEGTAGFRLDVGKSGRVENCTITRSTGHDALDQATCRLVTRRARFEAARNDQGDVVSGSFSSAVRWQIPE